VQRDHKFATRIVRGRKLTAYDFPTTTVLGNRSVHYSRRTVATFQNFDAVLRVTILLPARFIRKTEDVTEDAGFGTQRFKKNIELTTRRQQANTPETTHLGLFQLSY